MLQYRTKEIIEVKLTDELFEDGFLIRIIPEGTNYYLYLFHEDFCGGTGHRRHRYGHGRRRN